MSAKRHPTKNGLSAQWCWQHTPRLASELPKHLGNTENSSGTRHKHGIFAAYTDEKAQACKRGQIAQ